jgi:hypothetical protein
MAHFPQIATALRQPGSFTKVADQLPGIGDGLLYQPYQMNWFVLRCNGFHRNNFGNVWYRHSNAFNDQEIVGK